MENKLGISVVISHKDCYEVEKQIPLFARCGFDSFFLSYGVTDDFYKIFEWSKIAKENNIDFEAVHAPTAGVDSMWEDSGKAYSEKIMKIIDICSCSGVDKLVMHATQKPDVPVSDNGIENFRKIETYAKNVGVHICYENAVSVHQVRALLEKCDSFHGFCFDVGHHFCYTPNEDLECLVKEHLLYTHIHDNFGINPASNVNFKDMHLLPYDGAVNWDEFCKFITLASYRGTLNLELSCNNKKEYNMMSYEDFVKEAYHRIRKIRDGIYLKQ